MISIRQKNKKWRIGLTNEVWEYEDIDGAKKDLEVLWKMKESNGQPNDN